MPQLLAFYFNNQLAWTLLALGTVVYVTSVYVLPYFVELLVSRVYVTKL